MAEPVRLGGCYTARTGVRAGPSSPSDTGNPVRSHPPAPCSPATCALAHDMTELSSRPALVLLVEDDRDSRDMYAMGLDMLGLRVAVAGTAAEALRACSSERPDIVVTDLTLPDMDGLKLVEMLG